MCSKWLTFSAIFLAVLAMVGTNVVHAEAPTPDGSETSSEIPAGTIQFVAEFLRTTFTPHAFVAGMQLYFKTPHKPILIYTHEVAQDNDKSVKYSFSLQDANLERTLMNQLDADPDAIAFKGVLLDKENVRMTSITYVTVEKPKTSKTFLDNYGLYIGIGVAVVILIGFGVGVCIVQRRAEQHARLADAMEAMTENPDMDGRDSKPMAVPETRRVIVKKNNTNTGDNKNKTGDTPKREVSSNSTADSNPREATNSLYASDDKKAGKETATADPSTNTEEKQEAPAAAAAAAAVQEEQPVAATEQITTTDDGAVASAEAPTEESESS